MPFGSALLVTGRESMVWGEDAVQLELGRMSQAEAATMLAKLAGAGRVSADAGETARLVRLCDGLPLALRIAGARLGDERRRLHELSAGDLAVRSSLTASHTAHGHLANALRMTGHTDEAIAHFTAALASRRPRAKSRTRSCN